MAKSVFRYIFIIAVLVVIFGFGTNAFSATLADAYGVLTGNGWSAKDALGFLGTSIAGTLAMNPSLAPAAAAGALSAYIVVKSAELYDIYKEWRNIGTGVAMLNPVEYSGYMAVKRLANGEYGWWYIKVGVSRSGDNVSWYFYWEYREKRNDNGQLVSGYSNDVWFAPLSKDSVIYRINLTLQNDVPKVGDAEGRAILSAWLSTAYNNLVAGNNYSSTYSRDVVAALDPAAPGVNAATLGYRANVDPAAISEEGVQYLGDPDAFYQWFVTNYMNGVNEGTYVTPSTESYDEIRTQLETIITQLNNLQSTGGVSEETLNQLKTEILNAMNTQLSGVDSKLTGIDSKLTGIDSKLTGVDTKLDGLDSALTGVNTKLDGLDSALTGVNTKLDGVVSSIDTLSGEINETLQEGLEQERGFWDRLMEWLDETLWTKLTDLFKLLFLPTQEQLDGLFDVELPEYQKEFAADISFSSDSVSMPIALFGASVDLSGYISQYASGLRTFMNIFVSGMAAIFVIRAFRVHISID